MKLTRKQLNQIKLKREFRVIDAEVQNKEIRVRVNFIGTEEIKTMYIPYIRDIIVVIETSLGTTYNQLLEDVIDIKECLESLRKKLGKGYYICDWYEA